MIDLIQKRIFRELKDPTLLAKVYTTGEALAWSDDLEIDALNIYAKIANKEPSELARKYFIQAHTVVSTATSSLFYGDLLHPRNADHQRKVIWVQLSVRAVIGARGVIHIARFAQGRR